MGTVKEGPPGGPRARAAMRILKNPNGRGLHYDKCIARCNAIQPRRRVDCVIAIRRIETLQFQRRRISKAFSLYGLTTCVVPSSLSAPQRGGNTRMKENLGSFRSLCFKKQKEGERKHFATSNSTVKLLTTDIYILQNESLAVMKGAEMRH